MSTGQAVGGVIGAVVGYIAYGPAGILVGASIGYSIGGMIDPPASAEIAAPDVADLSAPTASEGLTIPDLVGTSQIANAANFLWYAFPRAESVKESSGGKGGGGEDYTTGYQYFLSFALGLCKGPVEAIYSIYENDTVLWTGGDTPLTIDDATNGKITITVSGRGTIDFYFGTTDQVYNTLIYSNTGYPIPWRGLCYAVFNDFMIGSYNRVGAMKFVVKKYVEESFNSNYAIGDYDVNPIHVIRYLTVNSGQIDSSFFDDSYASDVADVLYAEGRGISALLTGEGSVLDYLENVFFHIRGCFRNSEDGLLQPVIFRNDTSVSNMTIINDEDILEEIDYDEQSGQENQINGTYTRIIED